jgi:hypothetical protein
MEVGTSGSRKEAEMSTAKRFGFLAGLALLLAACGGQTGGGSGGGGGGGGGGSSPSFALALDPTSLTVQQGSSGTTTLTVTPQNGFSGTVNLSLVAGQNQVPQGLSLSPDRVQVPSPNPVTLTLSAAPSTPTGTYRLKVRGTSGSLTKEADLTVTVSAPSGGGGGAPQIGFEPSVQPPLYFVQGEVSPERNLGLLVVQPGTYQGRLLLEVLYKRNDSYVPEQGPYSLVPDAISVTGSDPIRTPLKLRQVGSYPHPGTYLDRLAFRVKGEDGTVLQTFEIGEVRNVVLELKDCYNYDLEPDAERRWHLGALAGIGGKVCVSLADLGEGLALRISLAGSSGLRIVKAVDRAPQGSGNNYHVYFGGAPASEGVYTDTLRVEPDTPGTFSYVEFPIAFHVGSKAVFSDYDGILVVAPRTSEGTEFGVYRTYTDASSEELIGSSGTYVYAPGTNPFPYLRGPIWWRYSYFQDIYGNYYESLVATDLTTLTDLGPAVENDVRGRTTYKSDLPCTNWSLRSGFQKRMILSDGTIICLVPAQVQQYSLSYYKVYRITPSQGVSEENIPERIPYSSSCDGFAYRDDYYLTRFWLRPGEAYFYYTAYVPDPDPAVGCRVPNTNLIPYRYDFASRSLQPISSIPSRDGLRNGLNDSPNFYNSNVHVSQRLVCVPSSQPGYLDDCLEVPSGYTAVGEQPSADIREWLVLLRSDDGSFQVWQPFAPGGSRFLGNPVSPQGSVAGYALAYPWLVLALEDTGGTTGPSYVIQALNVLDGRAAPSFLAKPWSPHLYPAWRQ